MVTTVLLQEDIEHIDLKMSLKGLMNVPGGISADVTHVYLDLNFISEIKINAFSHLKMCFLLNLINTFIAVTDASGGSIAESYIGCHTWTLGGLNMAAEIVSSRLMTPAVCPPMCKILG